MDTTVIAKTNKGHRVFLDYLTSKGYSGRYNVVYTADYIMVHFCDDGKRKLVLSKGGVCDLEGKRVTTWAQGSTQVSIHYDTTAIMLFRV